MSRRTFTIRTKHDRQNVARWAHECSEGVTVEFRSARRTIDQNAMLWAVLAEVSRQVVWYGTKLSSEDWKDVFTASLRQARVVPGIDAGTFVPLGMRTSEMTKGEFADLITLIQAFGAQHGVVFADDREASHAA